MVNTIPPHIQAEFDQARAASSHVITQLVDVYRECRAEFGFDTDEMTAQLTQHLHTRWAGAELAMLLAFALEKLVEREET